MTEYRAQVRIVVVAARVMTLPMGLTKNQGGNTMLKPSFLGKNGEGLAAMQMKAIESNSGFAVGS